MKKRKTNLEEGSSSNSRLSDLPKRTRSNITDENENPNLQPHKGSEVQVNSIFNRVFNGLKHVPQKQDVLLEQTNKTNSQKTGKRKGTLLILYLITIKKKSV